MNNSPIPYPGTLQKDDEYEETFRIDYLVKWIDPYLE